MRFAEWLSLAVAVLASAFCVPSVSVSQEHYLSEVGIPDDLIESNGEMDYTHMTVLGLTLGRAGVADVQSKLGQAEMVHAGHEPYICYRSASKGDNTVITFGFDDIGKNKLLSSFQIIAGVENFKSRRLCTKSRLVSKDVSTQSGLRIGLTPDQFKTLWKVPITHKGSHLFVGFDIFKDEKRDGKSICIDIFSSAAARFSESRLAWLQVDRGGEYLGEGNCESFKKRLEEIEKQKRGEGK
jgi:hypothetical protein